MKDTPCIKRYFRRPRLTVSEIVRVCREVAEKRDSGHSIDVFLSPAKAKQCVAAVLRYVNAKDKSGKVVIKSPPGERQSQFGFTFYSWQVDRDLRINLVSHPALASIGGEIVYVLDMPTIYRGNAIHAWDSARVEKSEQHVVFGCVKRFVAK